jgi:hypothetical protein
VAGKADVSRACPVKLSETDGGVDKGGEQMRHVLKVLPLGTVLVLIVAMALLPAALGPAPGPIACGKDATPQATSTSGNNAAGSTTTTGATSTVPTSAYTPCSNWLAFYAIGGLYVFLLWGSYIVCLIGVDRTTHWWNPARVFEGADGRASTSKFQFLVWTTVLFFAYVAIYAARWINGHDPGAIGEIPTNLILVTGMSIVTVTAAKSITASKVDGNQIQKTTTVSNAGASTTASSQPSPSPAPAPSQPSSAPNPSGQSSPPPLATSTCRPLDRWPQRQRPRQSRTPAWPRCFRTTMVSWICPRCS